jgi:MraZ protein
MYGEYEVNLDEKNRMLIPADFRRSLSSTDDNTAFFIKLGSNKRPWIYPQTRWNELSSEKSFGLDPTPEQLRRAQTHFAFTFRLDWDKQGRAVIPAKLLERTKTGKDVTLVGVQDHIEVWNRADWEKLTEELFSPAAEETGQAQSAQGGV